MNVLSWNYVVGSDALLDLINSREFIDQDDLAEACGMSVRSVERKVAVLKKAGLLEVVRTKERDVYYLIGEDVGKKYNSFEVKEIFSYRDDPVVYVHPEEMDDGLEEMDSFYKYPVKKKAKELTAKQHREAEAAINKLGY